MMNNTQLYGEVEILDKNKNVLFKSNNTILPYGKFKILSSLFSSKNEGIDGIKFLELYHTSDDHIIDLSYYNTLHKIKSFQINRRENIKLMQYDNTLMRWEDFGNILKQYKYNDNNYRSKYLLERYNSQIPDFYTFMNLFNTIDQCSKYNQIQIQYNVPIIKPYQQTPFVFNLLILTYGGNDVGLDEYKQVLTSTYNHEVIDNKLSNSIDPETMKWGSGLPFQQINLPETYEVKDQLYLNWKFVFNFNHIF